MPSGHLRNLLNQLHVNTFSLAQTYLEGVSFSLWLLCTNGAKGGFLLHIKVVVWSRVDLQKAWKGPSFSNLCSVLSLLTLPDNQWRMWCSWYFNFLMNQAHSPLLEWLVFTYFGIHAFNLFSLLSCSHSREKEREFLWLMMGCLHVVLPALITLKRDVPLLCTFCCVTPFACKSPQQVCGKDGRGTQDEVKWSMVHLVSYTKWRLHV